MVVTERLSVAKVEGVDELFTPGFQEYLLELHDRFTSRIHDLRAKRAAVLDRALKDGVLPGHLPPSDATTLDWQAPPLPEDLKRHGIEITGPASLTSMFINALNPGPDGTRAEGDLDDDEDAAGIGSSTP